MTLQKEVLYSLVPLIVIVVSMEGVIFADERDSHAVLHVIIAVAVVVAAPALAEDVGTNITNEHRKYQRIVTRNDIPSHRNKRIAHWPSEMLKAKKGTTVARNQFKD